MSQYIFQNAAARYREMRLSVLWREEEAYPYTERIVSILLIAVVLLQSGKAESASQIIQGGTSDLFANRKERGFELFVTRITYILGFTFFVLCLIISL